MRIILASGSPRRKQLLEQIGLKHEVIVSDVDETIEGAPDEQVMKLSKRKANAVCDMIKGSAIVIAADTLVYINNKVLGKPTCKEDAYNMLNMLQGNMHTVYTGVTVIKMENSTSMNRTFVASANVYFRNLSHDEIIAYIVTGESYDNAGAYGVQDKEALLVDKINGDYFTVVGLPVSQLGVVLRELGVEVWVNYD